MPLSKLEPQIVWDYFAKLCAIPRPSYQEEAVQQFVLDEAVRLGLHAERDHVGNILVRKPATQGKENAPSVILQAHLDMVAQKNHDSNHNFATDPIQTYIDGDWVKARGTTLGADNGIGAAAALAVLASNDVAHGNLEALFTACEESGMEGALGLQGGWLKGDILLNLDTETLGEICIGCAGGVDASFRLPFDTQNASGKAYALTVRGLKGGHSGIDIIKQRGNAIKILAHILRDLHDHIQLADLHGGTLRNAIPREAEAVFFSQHDLAFLQNKINQVANPIIATLPSEDENIRIELRETTAPETHFTAASQATILRVLNASPNGVDGMSLTVPNLVETSGNLSKVACVSGSLNVEYLLRSQNDFARNHLAQRLCDLYELAGGTAELSGAYVGWQPDPNSPIVQTVYREGAKLLDKQPEIMVIHAGLECGILGRNYPHWQMVSFGPTIEMLHSPDERVNIQSVAVFWTWLKNVLAAIK
ncbi:beta-Ala-His dipeptidase [Alysiella crassa]|uniref:beta-Ala-His dipeptidase n=1 Tax=Alysiella crassa TaxID=153491 RepID=UPI0005580A8B|nr:beta-Ala-His dipeptidase [Alysiella crassa]